MYNRVYLSENPEYVTDTTGLAVDELEALVGRFGHQSCRAGKLRGELREYADGTLIVYNNFARKNIPRGKIWSNE